LYVHRFQDDTALEMERSNLASHLELLLVMGVK